MMHERWVWLELIGFDNGQEDFGVGEYLDTLGFRPKAICLLLSSVDFILQHGGMEKEAALPPDICSREGHDHNQDRKRQVWTNHQVRGLIARLHERGVEAFVSVFAQYHHNRHHREWASDHPETRAFYARLGRRGGVNPLSRLRDGSFFEDLFLKKLLETLKDYGFDGWHGCDGYGPLSGAIYDADFSDDAVRQFVERRGATLPEHVGGECGDDAGRIAKRAEWIWREMRGEWIEFYAERWAGFWKKMVTALHREGKKAVINSAWGRAPFESLYRYGIDYKRIAASGVDGIVVESVAAGLCMDARASDASWHYDFLSMLLLLKAYVPDVKLIFLHNTHDIVEQWDALRHAPTVLEKEIYSLANVFLAGADGRLRRCADGFLACLGDGIRREEWKWLRERWDLAFAPPPRRVLGATLVWSDATVRNQVEDFARTRTWNTHRILYHLMERGAPVQAAARVNDLDKTAGPVLVINPHLFEPAERKKVFGYKNGPLIVVGRKTDDLPAGGFCIEDAARRTSDANALCCAVYGTDKTFAAEVRSDGPEEIPQDTAGIAEPRGYWDRLHFRKVSRSFLDGCAQIILQAAAITVSVERQGHWGVEEETPVTAMAAEQDDGRLRVALKSKIPVYALAQIDLGRPIESVRVLTKYPMMAVRPEKTGFRVKTPPKGVVVLEVVVKTTA